MDRPADSPDLAPPVTLVYLVEGLGSIGGNFMQVGIFFYTKARFGWGLKENFTLAALQGVFYVIGAFAAHGLSARFSHRRVATALYMTLGAIALLPLLAKSPMWMAAAVLVYTSLTGIAWPILESLVSVNVDARMLARRLANYNLVWAGTGAATIAVNGTIIDHWSSGVFVITAIVHAIGALLLAQLPAARVTPLAGSSTHVNPEPELLRVRTLALWLSRISVPASYALVYALSALLPSLPAMRQIPTGTATLIGSVWLASRWLTFLALGRSDWWHTRPRALLAAAWLMLAAFAGVGWQPSHYLSGNVIHIDLAWLIACQLAMGVAIGMVYYASLYFGMVLSEGSTEHSGYHEALIGLGQILGPGAGAFAQVVRPGETGVGIFAVTCVLWATTLLASVASIAFRRRERK